MWIILAVEFSLSICEVWPLFTSHQKETFKFYILYTEQSASHGIEKSRSI